MREVGGLGHYARSLDWNDPARERVVVCESIGIEIVVVVVEPVVGGWCRVRRVRRQRQICEVGEVTSTFRLDLIRALHRYRRHGALMPIRSKRE